MHINITLLNMLVNKHTNREINCVILLMYSDIIVYN